MTYVKLEDAVKAVDDLSGPVYGQYEKGINAGINRAISALRSLPTDDGWEDIECGPDETWCLAWDAYSAGTVVIAAKFYGVWQCRTTDEECRAPTHWRPLPAPPAC